MKSLPAASLKKEYFRRDILAQPGCDNTTCSTYMHSRLEDTHEAASVAHLHPQLLHRIPVPTYPDQLGVRPEAQLAEAKI